MKKVEKLDGIKIVVCTYYSKEFKWSKFESYDTYRKYVNSLHPTKTARSKLKGQTQIAWYVSHNIQLFHFSDANNKEELARAVAVEHLPFNVGEKVDFVNYCQRVLNLIVCCVSRTTFTCTLIIFIKKEKRFYQIFFKKLMVAFSYVPTYEVIISNFIFTFVSPLIILIMIVFYKKKK